TKGRFISDVKYVDRIIGRTDVASVECEQSIVFLYICLFWRYATMIRDPKPPDGKQSKHFASLLYVLRNRNESALGALIGWFIVAGQSERTTRSRIYFVKRKPNSYLEHKNNKQLLFIFET
ncbi:hypothetical protein SFRURICE_017751, partial [Spodoptera frugiperda]